MSLFSNILCFILIFAYLVEVQSRWTGENTRTGSRNSRPGSSGGGLQPRIIGGVNAVKGSSPYQLYWMRYGKYECGGTLVEVYGVQIVLTATHCAWLGFPHQDSAYPPRGVVVIAGDHNLNDQDGDEQIRNAKKIVCHGSYDPKYFTNDISIIFLEKEFDLNYYVDTAVLPGYDWAEPDSDVIVTGFGSYAFGGPLNNILQRIEIPVVEYSTCVQYNQVGVRITENVFCVGVLGLDRHLGSCMGDSGGPAIGFNESLKEYYLAGIISYQMTLACGNPHYPTVYTRVSRYTDWIRIEVSKFIEEERDQR